MSLPLPSHAPVKLKVMRVATVPAFMLHNMRGQIEALVGAGHEVVLVSSPDSQFSRLAELGVAETIPIDIPRRIQPLRDLRALFALTRAVRRVRPAVLHSTTPKAGLLCAIAGLIVRVPIRLHTFTGQIWVTLAGPLRWVSWIADRMMVLCSTRCYCDSPSQRTFLEAEGIAPPGRLHVLGDGSLSGVDLARFSLARTRECGAETRARLGIAATAAVVVFVGRVNRDKGVVDLLSAFGRLREVHPEVQLVIVGPMDHGRDALSPAEHSRLVGTPGVVWVDYDPRPERYLAAATIYCLPSYREGFPTAVLEAAALSVPTVGTRIVGMIDTVVHEQTGLLVPAGNVSELAQALIRLVGDPELCRRLGAQAQDRVERQFGSARLGALLLQEYQDVFQSVGTGA
jgi:glycosyltransferase involved in cell wall biosynthesis